MPRTLKLLLAYDGTSYVGWQRQAEGVSVQGLLEDALVRIEGHPVTVVGSGRTDAGVHALGQVASITIEHPIPTNELHRALNAMLPAEVRVREVEEAPQGFHARYAARGKTYRYALLQGEASPFLFRYAWHVGQPLALRAMVRAARVLEGTHDFAAFQSTGTEVRSTTRTVFSSTLREEGLAEQGLGGSWIGALDGWQGRLLTYEITGDGFLRHMVRAIVGSLVEVGTGRRDPEWMAGLLESGRREAGGPTAPACGLWLVGVHY